MAIRTLAAVAAIAAFTTPAFAQGDETISLFDGAVLLFDETVSTGGLSVLVDQTVTVVEDDDGFGFGFLPIFGATAAVGALSLLLGDTSTTTTTD